MDALRAIGISHAYRGGGARGAVLRDFSLTLAAGEFVALMGPSGSGKSTFLHLAAGLLVPDAGTIFVGEAEVTAMDDAAASKFRRRHEGVVFQSFDLLDALSVAENIALPARLDHARVDQARVGELLEALGLAECGNRRPSELSGGERQRVAIARALYAKPEVVLADEPTGNLDMKSAHEICRLLRELNKTEKSAILLVTHDPVVAATASRACFLKEGAIADSFATAHDAAAVSRRYLECYG